MRLLGVDFGTKRIGLAVADAEHGIASPRPPLTASGKLRTDAEAIRLVVSRESVDRVVLGLPIEESGDEGKMARIARQLAQHLVSIGIQVDLVDERLTSVESDRALRDQGLKASMRRKRRDAEAAILILERFMHGQVAS